jgi:hypothetical protein
MKKGRLLQFRQAAKARPQKTEDYLETVFWSNVAEDIAKLLVLYCTNADFMDNVGAHTYADNLIEFRRMQKSYPSTYAASLDRAHAFACLGKYEQCQEEFEAEKMRVWDEACSASDEEYKDAVIYATLSSGEGMVEDFLKRYLYSAEAQEELSLDLIRGNRMFVIDSIVSQLEEESGIDGEFLRFTIENDGGVALPNEMLPVELQAIKQKPEGRLLIFPKPKLL